MAKNLKVLAIIPARGGSKGVPRKNIKDLNGKPLIYYSIIEGQRSKYVDKVVVSTEDEEIKKVAQSFNCEVVDRPEEFATDKAKTEPVLQNVLEQLSERGEEYDIMVLLQCTTPFRKAKDIDKAIEYFLEKDADSVVSVNEVSDKANPHKIYVINEDGVMERFVKETAHLERRQDLPKVYYKNGMIYVVKVDLMKKGDLYGNKSIPFVMDIKYHVNIDEPFDFVLAEFLHEKGYEKLGE